MCKEKRNFNNKGGFPTLKKLNTMDPKKIVIFSTVSRNILKPKFFMKSKVNKNLAVCKMESI